MDSSCENFLDDFLALAFSPCSSQFCLEPYDIFTASGTPESEAVEVSFVIASAD